MCIDFVIFQALRFLQIFVLRNYQERKNLRHRKCNNKKRELSIFRKIIPQFFYLMNEQTDFENISLPLR